MRNIQIEAKVLKVVDQMKEGANIEDATVEIKSEWPTDFPKASRRLAGHANAARGEEILWVIGIDERNKAITGANQIELANWIPQIESRFDGVAPNLSKDLLVPLESGESVVALLFETDQAPYIVKHHKDSNFFEVPWRQGTRVRSAKRAELIRLLAPIINLPRFEVLTAMACVRLTHKDCVDIRLDLYNTTRPDDWIVIPFHKCNVFLQSFGKNEQIDFDELKIEPQSSAISLSENELMIGGPGAVSIKLHTHLKLDQNVHEQLIITLKLFPVDSDIPVTIKERLKLVFPDNSD